MVFACFLGFWRVLIRRCSLATIQNVGHSRCVERRMIKFLQLTKEQRMVQSQKECEKSTNLHWRAEIKCGQQIKPLRNFICGNSWYCFFFSFCSLQQSNLPVVLGCSITFKVACFPSLGITAPDTPVGKMRYRQSTGGTPWCYHVLSMALSGRNLNRCM